MSASADTNDTNDQNEQRLGVFFSSGWMGCVGSGKMDVHLWFWIWGGCFRLHLGQRDRKKLIASDEAAISETCSCGKSP